MVSAPMSFTGETFSNSRKKIIDKSSRPWNKVGDVWEERGTMKTINGITRGTKIALRHLIKQRKKSNLNISMSYIATDAQSNINIWHVGSF